MRQAQDTWPSGRCGTHTASMQTDHRAGLGGYRDTAQLTECVGREERFLLICTDADLDAQVHGIFLVCDQPSRTTSPLLQICRTVSEERCKEAAWARAGIPGRITEATFNSPGDHDRGGSLRKASGHFLLSLVPHSSQIICAPFIVDIYLSVKLCADFLWGHVAGRG